MDNDENTLSPAFLALRDQTHTAEALFRRLQRSSAPEAEVVAAEHEWRRLANLAVATLEADEEQAVAKQHQDRLTEALAAPMEANIRLAVNVVRAHGPMTAAEIEARRLPGLSHNVVRPVLREAQARGFVTRNQAGRRVIWAATA